MAKKKSTTLNYDPSKANKSPRTHKNSRTKKKPDIHVYPEFSNDSVNDPTPLPVTEQEKLPQPDQLPGTNSSQEASQAPVSSPGSLYPAAEELLKQIQTMTNSQETQQEQDTTDRKLSGERRTEEQIQLDRMRIAKLFDRGWDTKMIAQHLNISAHLVAIEKKVIYREGRKEYAADAKLLLVKKLRELAEVKREAWIEWERSKLPLRRTTQEDSSNKFGPQSKTIEMEEGRLGDPRYFNVIKDCVKQECDLLGLNAPKEISISGTMVNWDIIAGGLPLDSGVPQINSVDMELMRAMRDIEQIAGPKPSDTIYVELERIDETPQE